MVDRAQEGLSAILAKEDPSVKAFRVVSYASRACTDAERNYAPIERECLAATCGTEKYYHYLFGGPFKLVTDHEPLVPLLNNPRKIAPLRMERMRISSWVMIIKQNIDQEKITQQTGVQGIL